MTTFTEQDFINFVVRESRLIDQQRFDEWLEMFADDGVYWMPLEYGQTDPVLQTSLMYEDRLLLKVRVERLKGARTFSQKPKSRCHHLLQAPTVDVMDLLQNRIVTYTPIHYLETRLDEQTLFGAFVTHHLKIVDGNIKIQLKRIDLPNCDSSFGNIQLFM